MLFEKYIIYFNFEGKNKTLRLVINYNHYLIDLNLLKKFFKILFKKFLL